MGTTCHCLVLHRCADAQGSLSVRWPIRSSQLEVSGEDLGYNLMQSWWAEVAYIYIHALCMSFHQTEVKDPVIYRTNPHRVCPAVGNYSLLPSERGYRQICHNLTSWGHRRVCHYLTSARSARKHLRQVSVLSKPQRSSKLPLLSMTQASRSVRLSDS